MKQVYDDGPIIEITATPTGGKPEIKTFAFSTSSQAISGETVPYVAKSERDKAIEITTMFIDNIKDSYKAAEHKIVVKMKEEEKIDRGWFSHMDLSLGGGLGFDGGTWEGKVKGLPRKESRTKETIIEVSLEKKSD